MEARVAYQEVIYDNIDYYAKTLQENPSLQNANPISKCIQKLRIQRSYDAAIRKGETTAVGMRGAAERAGQFLQTGTLPVRTSGYGIMVFVGLLACVFLLFAGVTSCSIMGISGVSGLLNNSYLSEDADLLAAEAAYCAMETDLRPVRDPVTGANVFIDGVLQWEEYEVV